MMQINNLYKSLWTTSINSEACQTQPNVDLPVLLSTMVSLVIL